MFGNYACRIDNKRLTCATKTSICEKMGEEMREGKRRADKIIYSERRVSPDRDYVIPALVTWVQECSSFSRSFRLRGVPPHSAAMPTSPKTIVRCLPNGIVRFLHCKLGPPGSNLQNNTFNKLDKLTANLLQATCQLCVLKIF